MAPRPVPRRRRVPPALNFVPDSSTAPTAGRGRPPWWFRLLRGLLNLALLLLFTLQVFVLALVSTNRHLRLPDFVQSALEDRLQAEGVSVRFESMEVTLSGSLLLTAPQIYLHGSPDPVAEANSLLVEPNWLRLAFGGQFAVSELQMTAASLYCPPEASASGQRETLVSNFDVSLSNQGGAWWQLAYLHAQVMNARVIASGAFIVPPPGTKPEEAPHPAGLPPPPSFGPPAPAPSLAGKYRQWARQIDHVRAQLALIENPLVTIQLDASEPGTTHAQVYLLADGARPPVDNLTLGRYWMRVNVDYDGGKLRSATNSAVAWLETVHFVAPTADGEERQIVDGGPAWALVQLQDGLDGLLGRPPHVWLNISPVSIYGFAFDNMAARADLEQWPRVDFEYYASRGKNWLKAMGQVNIDDRTLALDYGAYVDPSVVLAAAREKMPAALNSLTFDRPPFSRGHITLEQGFKSGALDYEFEAGGVQFQALHLDAVRARGRLTPERLVIDDATCWNSQWRVDGGFTQNLNGPDFRVLVHGTLDPHVLDHYIGKWWLQVWKDIVPGTHWPQADIDYQGGSATSDTLFGSASVTGATVRGVPIDQVDLRIYQQPDVVAVYDIDAAAGGGRLSGAMMWLMKPPYLHNYEEHFVFDSTLPLAQAAKLAGPEVMEIVRPVDCPTPPTLHVDFRIGDTVNPQPEAQATQLQVDMPQPMRAYNVPLDWLRGNVTIYNDFTDAPDVDFGVAGGEGRAKVKLERVAAGNELSFNATIYGGHHTGFLSALAQFKSPDDGNLTSTPTAASAPEAAGGLPAKAGVLSDLARPGKMDLTLGAKMLLGHQESFAGSGHARIYEAKLGQLQLFGPLSRLLSNTLMPLGSLELDAATSKIEIANKYARFPDLEITGPSAKIKAAGLYYFPEERMDFRAVMFPLGQWKMPVISQIINLVSSPINAFTVNLRGTLNAPDWGLNVDPLRMFDEKTITSPPIPGYPSNPDGSPQLPSLAYPPTALREQAPPAEIPPTTNGNSPGATTSRGGNAR